MLAPLLFGALAACSEPDPPHPEYSSEPDATGEVAQPLAGEDGNGVVAGTNQIVNAYSALTASSTSGSSSLTVANIAQLSTPALGAVARGDLLMVIQMQGATIGTDNTASGYGNVSTLSTAGRYELVFAESTSGNTITLAVPLRYAYNAAGGAQVVRVPQYRSLIVPPGTSLTATDWNGTSGGVVALYVRDGLTLNGTIDVTARGFRGGAIDNQAATGIPSTYRSTAATDGAEKGEGIAGAAANYDGLGGRYGRGAAANGGGGGNAHNAGGGGGANGNSGSVWTGQGIMSSSVVGAVAWSLDPGYLANGNVRTASSGGGRGGYSFSANNSDALTVGPGDAAWGGDNRREYGGLGGRPLINDPVNGRLYLGGGGGAGDGNNAAAGAGGDGGGIVVIISDSVSGSGSIVASGEAGKNTTSTANDGAGGGGGGGSIIVRANSISGGAMTASGGLGGNQTIIGAEAEGPGGGGGGGYIATTTTAVTRTAAAANSGTTASTALTEFPVNGATHGAAGQVTTLGGELPFSYDADLTISVSDGTTTVVPGSTVTYTIAAHFSEGAPLLVTDAVITDSFPSSLLDITWTCTATPGSSCPSPTGSGDLLALISLARGGTVIFTVTGTLAPTASGSLSNTATITPPSGVWDPNVSNSGATDVDDIDTIPAAAADPVAATEDLPIIINVLANDSGLGDAPLSLGTTPPAHGAITVNADLTITYTPAPNYHGPDSFTYTVTDSDGQSSTATVSIDVASVDDVPVAVNDAAITDEDSFTSFDVLTNDSGLGDGPLTLSTTAPLHGTATVNGDGTIRYTPAANYHGLDSFTYTVTDADGQSATATVSMTVNSVDDVPAAAADLATTAEDTAVTINVLANDSGLGDAPITVTTTPPAHGAVVINPDGTIRYTPAANYHGPDSFSYTVTDADGQTSMNSVAITVTDVNDPPVATNDHASVDPGMAVVIPVLANDTDVDGDVLGVAGASAPLHGTIAVNPDGTIRYTPAAGYSGDDVFTYTVSDGRGGTAIGTVTISVALDSDHDGLPDSVETEIGTDPRDADSDDDGVIDGDEPRPGEDSDGDGRINALDPDSDNDGLYDGTELGIATPSAGTDLGAGRFVPDGDAGLTKTNPLDADTDDGGVADGAEDSNGNGVVDAGELNPNDPADDAGAVDSDGDGLLDAVELDIGTNPNDADSDDDGVIDGDEPDWRDDTDGDGLINPLDPDSDNDGLFDGTELGISTPPAATNVAAGHFIPDGDAGATHTSPVNPDTDRGGVIDGDEDANHDGVVDVGERNPNDPADDNRPDRDGDSVIDGEDNCPAVANADQADRDGDGIGDACDDDSDGDGLDDGFGVSGGGCSIGSEGGGGAGGASLGGLLLIASVLIQRRRRRVTEVASEAELAAAMSEEASAMAVVASPDPEPTATSSSPSTPALASLSAVTALSALVILSALSALSAPAAAQTMEPGAFPVERFRLSSDRNGLLDVEWAGTPGRFGFDLAMWMGYEDDPLVIYRQDADGRTVVGELVASRFAGDLVGSLGLTSYLAIGVDVPLILFQDRPTDSPAAPMGLASLSSFGLGDLRLSPKLVALRQQRHGISLALIPTFTLPTSSSDDAYFGDDGVTFEPALAISRTFGQVRASINLGVRFRKESRLADLIVDDEMFARAGLGYRFASHPLELDATMSSAAALSSPLDRFNENHLEALGGGNYAAGPLVIFAAAGFGVANGFGTPDWRALAGVRFGRGVDGGDRDSDGILDGDDRCPDEPEDKDGFQDRDGCPDPDNDGDGVLDVRDGAPMSPEDKDGFQDEDGVPDPDNDGDGVADVTDACPLEAGLADHRGCPRQDADNDGIPDDADRCPNEAEDLDGFTDTDGCPDLDNDGDGVVDASDRCPNEKGPVANEGCPDADRDGDTVVDRLDNCPDEKGTVTNHGCAQKQLVEIIEGKLEIIEPVFFKTNKDIIQARSYKLLDNVAAVLKAQSKLRILVEGHTDDMGKDAYNKDLSQRRAAAVVQYLVAKGVEDSRLRAVGYGEERPIASNKTNAGRATNRRVAFVIVSGAEGEIRVEQPSEDQLK